MKVFYRFCLYAMLATTTSFPKTLRQCGIWMICLILFHVNDLSILFHVVLGRWRWATFDSSVPVTTYSSEHPDGRPDNQLALLPSINSPYANWFWYFVCMEAKGHVNPDGVSFWLDWYFLRPAQFLAELVLPNKWQRLPTSTPFATMWVILQTPFFDCIASYPFYIAFSFIAIFLLLAFLGAPVGPQQGVGQQVNHPRNFQKHV